ncbi:hypothetical protein AV530_002216 [Patagioenas fasciata monilis]|uniref:Uncharacterized protein n=1 Tax=Patagioenas fasciata monilis TaxID=372326 RepID=A0A1V4K5K1_PATFA|nr:hypothetical protein AV530_002216 [Patagioenas fasciata monilis]
MGPPARGSGCSSYPKLTWKPVNSDVPNSKYIRHVKHEDILMEEITCLGCDSTGDTTPPAVSSHDPTAGVHPAQLHQSILCAMGTLVSAHFSNKKKESGPCISYRLFGKNLIAEFMPKITDFLVDRCLNRHVSSEGQSYDVLCPRMSCPDVTDKTGVGYKAIEKFPVKIQEPCYR